MKFSGVEEEKKEDFIICTLCPKGCRAILGQRIEEIVNREKLCKRGIAYVQEERREPKRLLTTTLKTKGSHTKLFPVRTSGPIPKRMLPQCMRALARLTVQPPIRPGEVIVSNLLDSGQDLIACDYLLT